LLDSFKDLDHKLEVLTKVANGEKESAEEKKLRETIDFGMKISQNAFYADIDLTEVMKNSPRAKEYADQVNPLRFDLSVWNAQLMFAKTAEDAVNASKQIDQLATKFAFIRNNALEEVNSKKKMLEIILTVTAILSYLLFFCGWCLGLLSNLAGEKVPKVE
jgi:hypothetical protein